MRLDVGDDKEAFEAFGKSLAIAERLAARDPENADWQRDVSGIYWKIGDVCLDLGDRKEAFKVYNKSIAIAERLAAQDPGNVE